jgi:NADH-quinone oxidoreductase subunit M
LLFTGPVRPQLQHIKDLQPYELLAAGILVSGMLLFGLLPAPLIELSASTIAQLHQQQSDGI